LVSLAGRFNKDGFDFQEANNEGLIRLVSLKCWSFTSSDEKHCFAGLMKNLDSGLLRIPSPKDSSDAENQLSMGYVALPHTMRQGSRVVSWYRGPLMAGENPAEIDLRLPKRSPDGLIRYDSSIGMFDATYAAAWQLGRLLSLQNIHMAKKIFTWRRHNAQVESKTSQGKDQGVSRVFAGLKTGNSVNTDAATEENKSGPPPKEIIDWIKDLSHLKGIPFNYLVPDERMLPEESIRFFVVDHCWLASLLDGALSIGRVTSLDQERDRKHVTDKLRSLVGKTSGFLLRSEVVSGWPGLLVDATDSENEKLKLLSKSLLSPTVMLCLFEGKANTIEICQNAEGLNLTVNVECQDIANANADNADNAATFAKARIDKGKKVVFKLSS
jgi:hypothetical protein